MSSDEQPEIEEGRYLYCLVRLGEAESETARDAFETTGVDGEPVSIVAVDDVGAVVHRCETIYDSADLTQIRRWLVTHQTVVDEAGEAFGTPVPFQFDTIMRGDDAGLREWLRSQYETVDRALSELADHWEYRVEVVETDPLDADALVDRDERLQDLDDRITAAQQGTAYLLEKQFENRVDELRSARRDALAADLEDRLADVTREVHTLDRSPAATLGDAAGGATDQVSGQSAGETVCRLTLLSHANDEDAVGSVLDDVAANPGLEVRFTGPWPPYTFAPELGGEDSGGTDSGSEAETDRDQP